jgi:hypothetical protein
MMAQGESSAITYGQLSNELNTSTALNQELVLQVDAEVVLGSDTNRNSFNIVEHLVQYGGRAWLHYYLTPKLKVTAAFGAWKNPDVPEAAQYDYLEFRSLVQLIYFFSVQRATTTLKAVTEQRFVQNEEHSGFEFKPRIRISPKILYALNGKVIREKTCYSILSGELYMTPTASPFFKITRITAGVGYNFTNDVGLELTYTSQKLYNTDSPTALTQCIAITFIVNNLFKRGN